MFALYRSPEISIRTFAAAVSSATSRAYANSGKDYSSSDDEKEPKKQRKPKQTATEVPKEETSAVNRLNSLLASMKTDDALSASNIARPGEANKRRKEAIKQDIASKDVITAAKNIASMLGSSEEVKKQTESELLAKLLGHNYTAASGAQENVDAAKQPQESELNLSELIVGMKIDRRQQPQEKSRGDYVRRTLASKSRTSTQREDQPRFSNKYVKREAETYTGSVNLFGSEPLGIFKQPETLLESPDILTTWAELNKRELRLQVAHPPSNYFEKMVRWTDQGKVWRFPIDNEQDLTEEVDVDFSEHIFLEQHLEPWCPTKGPVRHFMELVCVGLSKNPYVTAKDKKEHILWFRDYFEAKKDILKDLMSLDQVKKASSSNKLEA